MNKIELIPIHKELTENEAFVSAPSCHEISEMTVDFYKKVGFVPPWIGYFAKQNGNLVGSAGFKGQPVNGVVEIAYSTFEPYRNQGVGAAIGKQLVDLSLKTDPSVKITARTLPENNFSIRILKKNNFAFIGTVDDPDDGSVWEWEFKP